MSQKYLGGYLADTTSFTTPASGDPQFNYVTALLHGDGTNGAQNNTFIDSSTNNYTVTRSGTPTQGSFSPYGSLWSNYLNGSSDYFSLSPGSAFAFGTGDFTVEAWIFPTAALNSTYIIDARNGSQLTTWSFSFGYGGTFNEFDWSYSGSIIANGGTTSVVQNTWNHLVYTRSGTSGALFVNGTRVASVTDSNNYATSPTTSYIGTRFNQEAGSFLPAYVSNIRVVKGTAVYSPTSSTLTVPTTPLTAISGTVLLTCQSNRFADNSTNAFALTAGGSPSIQRFSPFNTSTAYSTSTIGGSGYFYSDNGQDLLTSTLNSSGVSLTGNNTIQFWMYVTNYRNTYVLTFGDGYTVTYRISLQLYSNAVYLYYGDVYSNKNTTQTQGQYLLNSWHHFAIVRNSNDIRIYIDGVDQGSYGTVSINPTSYDFFLGDASSSTVVPFTGYISNLVITQSAVYTSAFTPPTAPVTSGTFLLNFTNGGIYDNAMMNDLETVGNAQVSTSVVKFGTGSMYFNGSSYLYQIGTPNLVLGAGDFTIEFWLNISGGVSGTQTIIGYGATATIDNKYWSIEASGSNLAFYGPPSATQYFATTSQPWTSGWAHIAVCRSGANSRLFVNGTQQGSTYTSLTNFDSGGNLFIGTSAYSTSRYMPAGYIDDLRITKGYARYTANFTAPTAAFPNSYTPAVTTSIIPTATAAPGIWTMEQQAYYKAQSLWPTPPPPTPTVDYIVVAGGGGGGRYTSGGGCGGGGAGGFRTASSFAVSSGSALTVTVGAGGAAATNGAGSTGNNSVFSTITSNGGGGGGSRDTANPGNGGSGGGAAANSFGFTKSGGTGNTPSTSPSQGNNGGNDPGPDSAPYLAAGGGGASAVGADRGTGTGGAGTASSYSGSSVTYAGGGAGGSYSGTSAVSGGAGGGGNGGYDTTSATSGTANLGGGGGGAGNGAGGSSAGSGGSGVVVIRYANTYPDASATTGSPTYANTGGYKIYTFTSSGTITF